MNPKKITLFIISVLVLLLALTFGSSFHTTAQGVQEGFAWKGITLKYPTTELLFKPKAQKNTKAVAIIEEIKPVNEEDAQLHEEEKRDSMAFASKIPKTALTTNIDGKIFYPGIPSEFITKIKQKLQQPHCQIIHYGDSQIEGDRITSYVRNRLQVLFGGSGPGFFPIKMVYNQKSIDLETSLNWFRYAAFDRKQEYLEHAAYGIYGSLSRFTPYREKPVDTVDAKFMPIEKAYFTIRPSLKSYRRLRHYTKMQLHYGNNRETTMVTVYENGIPLLRDSLQSDGKYHAYEIAFPKTPDEIRVELEGKESPDFYGVTLDDSLGIRMDNVAMRGEAGRFFSKLNKGNFRQMSEVRHPDIIIFQYGGNTVPYLKDKEQIKGYVTVLMNNIKWVQQSNPEAVCLLIGPGDMATSINGQMQTYPFLPKLNDEMKRQSLKNNIAYWSLFEAMGGEGAIISWVEKGIGSPDYIHFRPEGTQLVSEMLFQCLHDDLLAID
ncbi:MAG: lipase [Capnocytophaga sp.]|nr:lipase [Capnocytophaga sp.]